MATHIIVAAAIFAAAIVAIAGVSAVMIIKGEMDRHRDDTTTWPPFAPIRDPLHDLSDKQADFASGDDEILIERAVAVYHGGSSK